MVELHVHDPQRLQAAGIDVGWPGAETDEHSDDPDDVLDAAMCLTEDLPPLPGADLITIESMGQILEPAIGDEASTWSPTPTEVAFGMRLSDRRHHAATRSAWPPLGRRVGRIAPGVAGMAPGRNRVRSSAGMVARLARSSAALIAPWSRGRYATQ